MCRSMHQQLVRRMDTALCHSSVDCRVTKRTIRLGYMMLKAWGTRRPASAKAARWFKIRHRRQEGVTHASVLPIVSGVANDASPQGGASSNQLVDRCCRAPSTDVVVRRLGVNDDLGTIAVRDDWSLVQVIAHVVHTSAPRRPHQLDVLDNGGMNDDDSQAAPPR